MRFKYADAPSLDERVELGRRNNSTEDGAIVQFPEDWNPEHLMVNLISGKAGALYPLLNNEGYELGSHYLYRDPSGRVISMVQRLDHSSGAKKVLPFRAAKVLGCRPYLESKALDGPRPFYNLHLLFAAPAAPVLLVEGEKAADAAQIAFPEMVVTTWPGGSGAITHADLRVLAGRNVTIWPDHDQSGWKAALAAGEMLQELGASGLRFVLVPDAFPAAWDPADPLPAMEGADDGATTLQELLERAVTIDAFVAARGLHEKRSSASSDAIPEAGADRDIDTAYGVAAVTYLINLGVLDIGEYPEWNRLAIAFKNSFGVAGFAPWLELSRANDNFESEDSCRKAWDGIKVRPAGADRLTIATYIAQAKESGWISQKGTHDNEGSAYGPPSKNEDHAAYAVGLALHAGDELWLDQEARPHVTYSAKLADGSVVKRHLPISGSVYRSVLQDRYFEAADRMKTLKDEQAASATAILAMQARRSGVEHSARLRVGTTKNQIYVDLGTEDGSAVEIDSEGWRVVSEPPVRFVRGSRGKLPVPQPGGSLEDFRPHFNLSDDDLRRALAFMIGSFNVAGSYPMLLIDGEQGSCKSTLSDKVLGLVDPPHQTKSARMSFNAKEQDLHILAQGAHLLAFDNLSTVSADAADVLCRIATGGASATRELYSNDRISQLVVVRPVLMTCIGAPTTRPDFLDRTVRVTAMPVARRLPERIVEAAFERDRSKLLGVVFSGVSAALRRRPAIEAAIMSGVLALPRMADFAEFVEGAHETLGLPLGGFSALLKSGQETMQVESVLGDPVGAALVSYFSSVSATEIEGSANELLRTLKERGPSDAKWPAVNVFGKSLTRIAVGLRHLGIELLITAPRGRDNVARYKLSTTSAFRPQASVESKSETWRRDPF